MSQCASIAHIAVSVERLLCLLASRYTPDLVIFTSFTLCCFVLIPKHCYYNDSFPILFNNSVLTEFVDQRYSQKGTFGS